MHLLRFGYLEDLLAVVRKVATRLVSKICRCLTVALHSDRVIDTHGTVVGGYDDGMTSLGEHLQHNEEFGMLEP